MPIVFIVMIYAAVLVFDIVPTFKKHAPGVAWVCLAVFALGFALQALHSLNIYIPSPSGSIAGVVSSLTGAR